MFLNSLKVDNLHNRIAELESEVVRLKILLNVEKKSHTENCKRWRDLYDSSLITIRKLQEEA